MIVVKHALISFFNITLYHRSPSWLTFLSNAFAITNVFWGTLTAIFTTLFSFVYKNYFVTAVTEDEDHLGEAISSFVLQMCTFWS